MGEFLTRLTSFFNFHKTVNVSAPGLMVAGALLLFNAARNTQTYPEYTPPDFDKQTMEELRFPEPCKALSTDFHPSRATSGRPSPDDWTKLQKRRATMDDCSYRLQQLIRTDQSAITQTAQQIVATQKIYASLMKRYEEEVLVASPLANATLALATEKGDTLQSQEAEAKRLELGVAFAKGMIPRLAQESEAISKLSHTGEQDGPFGDVVSQLSNHVMYFLIFGILCGLVLDPIMSLIQPLLYTDARVLRANASVNGVLVVPRHFQFTAYNVNYALGLGLITEAEVESLRRRYMYPSQMLLNLILPGILLLIATGLYLDTHLKLGS